MFEWVAFFLPSLDEEMAAGKDVSIFETPWQQSKKGKKFGQVLHPMRRVNVLRLTCRVNLSLEKMAAPRLSDDPPV